MPFSTDDLAAWRARQSPADESTPKDRTEPDPDKPIRFTLRELLIAVTVVGVLLGILRAAGIFGAVFAFLATVVFTWGVYPALRRDDLRAQRAMFDFLWGVGMPLICLVFDPFVFKEHDVLGQFSLAAPMVNTTIYDHAFVVYAFVGCQMLVMAVWLMLGSKAGIWTPLLGGFLVSGLLFAALVGFVLVIPAAIGVFFVGIGLLGLTPLITTYSYGRQCSRALANNWHSPANATATPLAVLGFCVSLVLPVLIGVALLAALRGPEAVGSLLRDL